MTTLGRRSFLATGSAVAATWTMLAYRPSMLFAGDEEPVFRISLAQWSLHKTLFSGKLDNLDFAKTAKEEFGIEGVEYVNQFFKEKATDIAYLKELKQRAEDHGVSSLLIMIDGEGALGDKDEERRTQAIENHKRWVDAARLLGCHSIRVNAESTKSYEEAREFVADGLRRLSEYAGEVGINVIVENHGGLSSNGKWLSETIQAVGLPNCGTLPDFGNFYEYDRYQGVEDLMPFAKAVSAKSYDFDDEGNETKIDFFRMMKIVLDAGYRGWVGIEYEGSRLDEYAGIRATKTLLERCLEKFS